MKGFVYIATLFALIGALFSGGSEVIAEDIPKVMASSKAEKGKISEILTTELSERTSQVITINPFQVTAPQSINIVGDSPLMFGVQQLTNTGTYVKSSEVVKSDTPSLSGSNIIAEGINDSFMNMENYQKKLPFYMAAICGGNLREMKKSFPVSSNLVNEVFPTCNYSSRMGLPPIGIVLHFTEGFSDQALTTFREVHGEKGVSAHYIVKKDGTIIQVVPEEFSAWHVKMEEENRQTCKIPSICGDLTRWQSLSGNTIGIEIENLGPVSKYDDGMYHNKFGVLDTDTPFKYEGKLNGVYRYEYWDEYTPEQLEALKFLVEDIRSRWDIPKDNVVRHSDLQSKNDPGPALDEWMEINGYASLTK